jgi:protein O-GlcNAc transferase
MVTTFLAAMLLLAPSHDAVDALERLKQGQQLMATERFEQAAEAFREAIRLDPVLVMAHYGLGQAHMALKQYPKAVTAFRGARDAFHSRAADHVTRRLEDDIKREDRIRALRDKIRENQDRMLNPNTPDGRIQQMRIQQWEVEISTLQRPSGLTAGSATPSTPAGISLALGSAHFRTGQMAEAEKEYRAALEAQPTLGETRNNLAVVLLLTGRPAEARDQLQLAEKNGFRPPAGLKQDIEKALATVHPPSRQ